MYINGPEDDVIQRKGLDGYFDMAWTDAEVLSCLWHMLTLSIPGWSVTPYDDSPESARNTALVDAVLSLMEGSTLDTFQNALLNGLITGFTVAEPSWQNITVPGQGLVKGAAIGLRGIDVRPSKSFLDGLLNGILVDKYGYIESFTQSSEYGGQTITPDKVVYWAHLGTPDNRYGQSALRCVYEPWAVKQKIRRIYQVFMSTNASGIRVAKIPDKDFGDATKRQNAQNIMERLGSLPSIATAASWDMTIDIPPAGAGAHFQNMLDWCNREIRRGLLGDSAFSSQEGAQGSLASREVSQQNVSGRFASLGRSFTEALTEQIVPLILAMNGFSGPSPRIVPLAAIKGPDEREKAFATLGQLRRDGIIDTRLPDALQLRLVQNIFEPLDIEVEEMEPKPQPVNPFPPKAEPEAEPKEEPKPDEDEDEKAKASAPAHVHIHAAEGQKQKQGRRQAEALTDEVIKRAADLSDTWARIMPEVQTQINKALFENKAGGGWRTTNLSEIRQLIVDKCKFKSSEIRNSLTAGIKAGRELGLKAAAEMLPVQAAGVKSWGWTPTGAREALHNRVQFLIEEKYGKLASQIYNTVENALMGNLSILETEARISRILGMSPFSSELPRTIMDTAMATAWNAARMEMFSEIEDPNGTGASSIVAYEFLAVEDEHTTDTCLELNGKVFSVDDPALPVPPLHFNCRSVLLPVFGNERADKTVMSKTESSALVNGLRSTGGIQDGFGGV
jgi:SPP1 gp7 family putative phage head morphogenesis protein